MNLDGKPQRSHVWPYLSLLVVPLAFAALHHAVPLRPEHLLAAAAILALAWSEWGRRLTLVLAPLTAVGFGYEAFAVLGQFRGRVLVDEIWNLEHSLFPAPASLNVSATFPLAQEAPAWSDVIATLRFAPFDLLSGVVYLTHVPVVIAVSIGFFLRKDLGRAKRLAWGFFVLNIIGWLGWLVLPAAPPWYVDLQGLGPADFNVPASAAGAARFDELVGYPVFEGFYGRSTNVFGAFPSLHAAYAILVALAGWTVGPRTRWVGFGYACVMCFSAIYLRHHYIVDVIGGGLCSAAAYWLSTLRWGQLRSLLPLRGDGQSSASGPVVLAEPVEPVS